MRKASFHIHECTLISQPSIIHNTFTKIDSGNNLENSYYDHGPWLSEPGTTSHQHIHQNFADLARIIFHTAGSRAEPRELVYIVKHDLQGLNFVFFPIVSLTESAFRA